MSIYEKLQLAKKEGGIEMQFQDLPEFAVFLPFKKDTRGSLRIKINPTKVQLQRAGIIPSPEIRYSINLDDTLSDSFNQPTQEFFEKYSKTTWFTRQIKQYPLDCVCTYFGQLFDLFPSL